MTARTKPSPDSATGADALRPAAAGPAVSAPAPQFVFILPSDARSNKRVETTLLGRLFDLGYDEPSVFAVKLALEEAVSNAVRHGNCDDPLRCIRVEFTAGPDRTEICVSDEGCGFNPAEVPDPTAAENLELPSGRGIMLMRAFMNEVCYNPAGNCVRMVKLKGAPTTATLATG
jgi:serine/threonine-protein kinase RsbW